MAGTGQSPFSQTIAQLETQGTTEETTVAVGTTEQTTVAATTEQTTTAPEGTSTETTEAPVDATIIDELRTQYGVEDVLDNTVEGVQSLIEKVSDKAKVQALKEKFEARPILGALDAHLEAGKSLESFFEVKQVEAQQITLPKLTGDDKQDAQAKAYYKQVITANLKATGISDKQVGRIIESSELENSLFEDAEEAATSWNNRIKAQAQQISQQEEQARLKAIEDDKKTVADINKLIDGGVVNGAVIPTEERQALKDFMLKQDDKGNTARDIKLSQLTLEQWAVIDYMLFKDFKLKGFTMAGNKGQPLNLERKNPLNNNGDAAGGNAAETRPLPSGIKTLDFRTLNGQVPVL